MEYLNIRNSVNKLGSLKVPMLFFFFFFFFFSFFILLSLLFSSSSTGSAPSDSSCSSAHTNNLQWQTMTNCGGWKLPADGRVAPPAVAAETAGDDDEELRLGIRRELGGPGSSPPRCGSKCGKCTPCKAVHVPVRPGTPVTAEYYPEAWRCKCGNKLYMP